MYSHQALLVGINHYRNVDPLKGCLNDVALMEEVLAKHEDSRLNFQCDVMISEEGTDTITIGSLHERLEMLLDSKETKVALFYFSGHGSEATQFRKGCLVTQDGNKYHPGLQLEDLIDMANVSPIPEVVIILDCCFSGNAGNASNTIHPSVQLREGVSIMTASQYNEAAKEGFFDGKTVGKFTSIIYKALKGEAADVTGTITIADLYDCADKLLSVEGKDQRPIFKAYLQRLTEIRRCKPKVDLDILAQLPSARFFVRSDYQKPLSPAYEPSEEPRDPEKEAIFKDLQLMARQGLVRPVGAEHMYYAAIHSKACELTPYGQFIWQKALTGFDNH